MGQPVRQVKAAMSKRCRANRNVRRDEKHVHQLNTKAQNLGERVPAKGTRRYSESGEERYAHKGKIE
jgi:hypothetical protein